MLPQSFKPFRTSQKEYNTKKKHKDNIESFGLLPFYVNYKKENGSSDEFLTENRENRCRILEENTDYFIEYLLQQRRDTFEYDEYLQGMWPSIERVKILFSSMTVEELKRNSEYIHMFDELWDDLWVDKTTRMYKEGYVRAKKKYEEIENDIQTYIKESNATLISPPWGFPKGRKNSYSESDQECAIRESEEECRVPRDLYRVLPFKYSEKFLGSNGVSYSTTYFLCEVKERYIPPRIDTSGGCIRTTSISEEVNDVAWLTYENTLELLNFQRKLILCEANASIKKYIASKT